MEFHIFSMSFFAMKWRPMRCEMVPNVVFAI